MGIVSGIIMPFQFRTNWSRFSDAASNVSSLMLAYEDLKAFFWFGLPHVLFLAPVAVLTVVAFAAWQALGGWGGDAAPFLGAMGLFLLSYLGIAISFWPMIVPGHFTLWQAASSEGTRAFLLVGRCRCR